MDILTNTLPGFMELLPEEQLVFNRMRHVIQDAYETFGFIPVDTPVLERAEVLLAKAGGDTEKQMYRFMKGDTDLAMRFDLTVPLARYVAEHYNELHFPFRRYAIGKVYRGERPQAGRFREFYQADIDIIGDETLDLRYDAELPSIIYMIFKKLDLGPFVIRVNNRKILGGLFASLGLQEHTTAILQSIDRIEKIGVEGVREQLQELGLEDEQMDTIFSFVAITGSREEVLEGLKELDIHDELFSEGVAELETVTAMMEQLGIPKEYYKVDLTIARGLDYYTGTVYETVLTSAPGMGSVCSGGRYENLASHYTKKNLPGVGISIGLTRLFDQLRKHNMLSTPSKTPTKVLIMPFMDDLKPSLELATVLREAGIATEVSFETGKPKKRMRYPDRLGIPYVIFIGDDEIAKGVYTIKDLTKGTQEEVDQKGLVKYLTS